MKEGKKKIVALGDSITYGYPYDPSVSWVEAINNEFNIEVINAGISGDTFADMYRRLERDVISHKPDMVILMGGTNDVYQGFSYLQIQQSLFAIEQKLFENNIKLIIGLPLPVEENHLEKLLSMTREWLRGYAKTKNYKIIDFHQDFIEGKKSKMKMELTIDGCHPTKQGYIVMGVRAVEFFRNSI